MRSGAVPSTRLVARRYGVPVAAVVALLAVVLFVVVIGGEDDVDGAATDGSTSAAAGEEPGRGEPGGDGPHASDGAATDDSEPIRVATPETPLYDARPEEIPLDVEIADNDGLADGDVVSIRVEPSDGATEGYGFTAFLCRGDVDVTVDAEARPTHFGYCASQPLSPGTDSLVEVAAQPPYHVAEGQFRVGVGSDTFELRDGRTATVTCGPDDPCQLVLKLQFPNGYGLRSFPLTFR